MRSLVAALWRVPAIELAGALVLSFIAMASAFAVAPDALWTVDRGTVRPLQLASVQPDIVIQEPEAPTPSVVLEPWPRVLPIVTAPIEAPSKKPAFLGDVKGLKPHFLEKLRKLRSAMPKGQSFYVASGYRSLSVQAALYRQKPGLAAPPHVSNHPKGLAADLKFSSSAARLFVHANAGKHGLRFPMRHENWHVEPAGVTRYAKRKSKRVRPQYVQASGWQ